VLSDADWQAIWLTLKLATLVTVLLLIIGTPIAWWLARSNSVWRRPVNALIALPLVLPPTVIGFYLLIAFSPEGIIGRVTESLGLGTLAFSFSGLVVASVIYSLPFVVQPLRNAFAAVDFGLIEAAKTLRADSWDCFRHIVLPLSRPGFVTAAVLGFAHTLGEFGVVLMIGGNIPGETRVVSVQIYDHVEALQYSEAHWLAAVVLVFSFILLLLLYSINPATRDERSWL
jgi:molybdate transport system permease protein